MKVKFVSQPFLINGSGFIHQKRFFTKSKNPFSGQTMRDTKKILKNKIVRFKKIYKFCFDHFLIKFTVFVLRALHKRTLKFVWLPTGQGYRTMSARQIAEKFKFHAGNLMIVHNSGIYEIQLYSIIQQILYSQLRV